MGLQLLRLILLLTALALCAHCSDGEGAPSEAGWMVGVPCDDAPVGGCTGDRSQQHVTWLSPRSRTAFTAQAAAPASQTDALPRVHRP